MKIHKAIELYFYYVGVFAHVVLIIGVISATSYGGYLYSKYDLPVTVFLQRVTDSLEKSSSPLLKKLSRPVSDITKRLKHYKSDNNYQLHYSKDLVGASVKRSTSEQSISQTDLNLQAYHERLKNFDVMKLRTVNVNSSEALLMAIKSAKAGDDIVILPGEYKLNQKQIYLKAMGSQSRSIRIRAKTFGEVVLKLNTLEGFVISGDYWVMENLSIQGVCINDSQCEHAVHIVGAQHLIIRNNEIKNFNSPIKANGIGTTEIKKYPDHILFEYNSLFNEHSRETNSSVTLLDIVSGSYWIIRKNFIANNSKHGSDYVSYAMFLKGNGSNSLVEKNIVDCQWSLANDGYTRVGISLGGGGTAEPYCREGSCPVEYTGGVIENNIIANCSEDVGIYLNKAKKSKIIHNTLINTLGVDVRFPTSSAKVFNNVVTGMIRSRDYGVMTRGGNITELEPSLIFSPPLEVSQAETDFCDDIRFKFSLVGAMGSQCMKEMALKVIEY